MLGSYYGDHVGDSVHQESDLSATLADRPVTFRIPEADHGSEGGNESPDYRARIEA